MGRQHKNIEEVAERLQDIGIQALTIHGRTRVQMYKGAANWELIARIKNNPRIRIPIFGNGDIDTPQKALNYKNTYGVDGIMIGRASIGNPWIFNQIKTYLKTGIIPEPPSIADRVETCRTHLEFSIRWKGAWEGIVEMRRHYAPYFKGLENFKPFRNRLVEARDSDAVLYILDEVSGHYEGVEV